MSDFIFKPLSEQVTTETNNEYYAMIGYHDFIDNDSNPRIKHSDDTRILAQKIIRDDGSIKYAIKFTRDNKMENPLSIYDNQKDNKFLDRVCRSNDRFKEVNPKVFGIYLNFLKTKNISWLHNAEREAM